MAPNNDNQTPAEYIIASTRDPRLSDTANRVNALVFDLLLRYIGEVQVELDSEEVDPPDADMLAWRARGMAEEYGLAGIWDEVLPSVKARIASESAQWNQDDDEVTS